MPDLRAKENPFTAENAKSAEKTQKEEPGKKTTTDQVPDALQCVSTTNGLELGGNILRINPFPHQCESEFIRGSFFCLVCFMAFFASSAVKRFFLSCTSYSKCFLLSFSVSLWLYYTILPTDSAEEPKKSTMLKRLNEGKYKEAADEFPKWNKVTVDGVKVPSEGLSKRRARERKLFLKGKYE